MKLNGRTFTAVILLALAWHFLFWQEKAGINISLFFLLASSLLLLAWPWMFRMNTIKATFLACFLLCIFIVIFNSWVSIISFWIIFAVLVGFAHQATLRSPEHALLTAAYGLLTSPMSIFDGFSAVIPSSTRATVLLRYIRLSLIPFAVLFFFLVLYSFADPEFNFVTNDFITRILNWWLNLFDFVSFRSVLFFLGGLLVSAALLFNRNMLLFATHEKAQSDFLVRKQTRKKDISGEIAFWQLFFRKTLLSLKNEYVRGIILLIAVNALLLLVNVIDVKMVWFEHQAATTAYGRSQAVHESVYILIFSILLAMAILLFFFRGNINFLKQNIRLKQLAYLWIIQNGFLAVTVAIRNYYYVRDFGLAYNRIGVFFFLLLTLFGLLTLFLKIRDKKSFFFLYRINGWACCALLVLMSCFNWDPWIASYNLTHFTQQTLDREFLKSLSNRALPVIIQHKDIFIQRNAGDTFLSKEEQWLADRTLGFMDEYTSVSWLSWNYADYSTYRFLTNQNQPL